MSYHDLQDDILFVNSNVPFGDLPRQKKMVCFSACYMNKYICSHTVFDCNNMSEVEDIRIGYYAFANCQQVFFERIVLLLLFGIVITCRLPEITTDSI